MLLCNDISRHSLSDPQRSGRGRGGSAYPTPSRSSSRGEEMYSSQGASHGFRGFRDHAPQGGGAVEYDNEYGRSYTDGYYDSGGSRYGNETWRGGYDAGYYGDQPGGGGGSRYGNDPRHPSGEFLTESAFLFVGMLFKVGVVCPVFC